MPLLGATGGGSAKGFGALANLGYFIRNSLRFRGSASGYLSRTFSTGGTSRQIQTYSLWVKRGSLGVTYAYMFGAYDGSSGFDAGVLFQSDALTVQVGGVSSTLTTTQVFRDPSAWYHIVVAIDTTQATSSNRVKLYVNGNQVTAFSTATYPTQNANIGFLYANSNNRIGTNWNNNASTYFDGYMADINFIDGQALTPSSFGKTDAATGQWIPKKFAGTYGTNGFYLKFADASAATAAAIGKDSSGNGNNWTPNNISVTAGVTYDAMTDVPTLTSATVANYAVANPLDKSTNVTVTNGSLTVSTAVTNAGIRGSMYVSSGKYYWEATCTTKTSYPNLGIADASWGLTNVGSTSGSYGYATDGLKYNNGSTASYGATYTSGDVIGVALDLDAGTLVFYKNNTSQGTAYSSLSGTFAPAFAGQGSDVWNVNFGQRPFAYTPPAGFKSLNTFNLP